MLADDHPDRIQITFDDRRLVANAGLLLPVTLAQHLGLRELVDHHLDLGNAPGRANPGDKMLTLVASALAGGDCIDDGRVAHRGNRPDPGLRSQGAIHPGDVPAQLPVGPRPPIGSGQPRAAGTGLVGWGRTRRRAIHHRPGFDDLRDIRSGQGGGARPRLHGQRGYHPLLAVAAGTGDVLMARLREGRANTARGAAHFLRETVGRVRYAGARGQLTVRADSGFYTHAIVVAAGWMSASPSPSASSASLRSLIEAIPEQDWTPIPYWMEGAADVAETSYTPFQSKPDAAPVRLIVRRVKPTPGSQWPSSPPTAITASSPTGRGKPWHWRPTIGATPRSRTPSETSSTAWG